MVLTCVEKKSAFGRRILNDTIYNNGTFIDPIIFMEDARTYYVKIIAQYSLQQNIIKVSAVLKASFVKEGN